MHDRQFTNSKVKKNHADKHHYAHSELNSKVGKTVPVTNKHHVIPKHPDKHPRTIKVDEELHKCFHKIFGNPKNLEDAICILKRDWYPSK
jgi:hypothetical protein